nr:HlyD family efflux transporter periplasmic adaptor subunit [uncultured Undibacterium sp.]
MQHHTNQETNASYQEIITLRPEAIKSAQSNFGAPVRLSGVAGWTLSGFFISIFVVAIIFICTTKYSRKETVQGQVTAIDGALRIMAIRNGLAEQVLVSEGQVVRAGQELVSISSSPKLQHGNSVYDGLQRNQKDQLDAHLSQVAAKREQVNGQRTELQTRKLGIVADIQKLVVAKDLQHQRIQLQEQTVAVLHKLGEEGHVANLNVRARDEALIAARQAVNSLDREIAQQHNLVQQLEIQLKRLSTEEVQIRTDSHAAKMQFTEKQINAEGSYTDHLTSPTEGIVTALQVKKGAAINVNQTLAIILPSQQGLHSTQNKSGLEVELWAPSRSVGFIKPGTKVRLMFDSFPYQSFGVGTGVVRDISLAPSTPNDIPIPESKEQLFRIRVSLSEDSLTAYGKAWPLVAGMSLSADLVLEERSLLDWLLEPLLAAKKRAG